MNNLLLNINKIHTTELGYLRIKRNLCLDIDDVVSYCKKIIMNNNCLINKKGKNWYCKLNNIEITINSFSYTIITAKIIDIR